MFTHVLRRAAATLAAAFLATLIAACGGNDFTAPQSAPTIASFTATPALVPAGGGPVVLSWSTADASQIVIDNGVGDVSGSTGKTVNVSAGTTFTMTASNGIGNVTAATTVAVAAQPAPTISSFTATPSILPVGGGSVTLSWTTTGATSLSIDNGVGVVAGSSTVVNVATGTTFTLTAGNAVGTAKSSAAVTIGSAVDRYLDATGGNDANPCTQAAPCKTIAKGMNGAAAGATVHLADGSYGAEALGGSVTIPDGVALRATHAGAASVVGVALNAAGSTTLDGLVLDAVPVVSNGCGSINATAASGTPTLTLTGVLIKCVGFQLARGGTVNIGGVVQATMTPGALTGGVYTAALPANANTAIVVVNDSAALTITGGVIDGNNGGDPRFGSGLIYQETGSPRVTLDAVTIRNSLQPAIAMFAFGGSVVLRNGTLIDNVGATHVGGCDSGGTIVMVQANVNFTMDHSTISNSPDIAICVMNQVHNGTLNFIQSTITQSGGTAIQVEDLVFGAGATVTADGLSLTNNGGFGIFWSGSEGGIFDLRNMAITGNALGGLNLQLPAGSLKLRGSTVSGSSQAGVILKGTILSADLGTSASPGGNTFTGSAIGLRSWLNAGQTVNAVGNTWIANQQGADANGRYSLPPTFTPVPKIGPASGVNFKIDNATALNL